MIRVVLALLRRDLGLLLGGRRGGTLVPLLFFLSVATLYPFAVGPELRLLGRTGGGVVWIAALLAAILPLDRLVSPDLEQGFLDQLALRGIAEEVVMAVRMLAHWLCFGPPLMLAAFPAGGLLGMRAEQLEVLVLSLLAGTPGLAAVGVMIGAITASLRSGSALAGVLLLPLSIPLLIFGAGSIAPHGEQGIVLTAAVSLALVAVTPFAAGAAVRAAREG